MKAAVLDRPGGPDVLRYDDVADPSPGVGDVLVEVAAVSIEGGDTLHRANTVPARVPHIVGYQCAATVIAVGSAVTRLRVGDRVVTVGVDGSHAELRVAPERLCWRIPDGLAVDQAACVPVAFGTAADALFEFGHVAAGDTVLVQAAAGGVGIAAVQLAHRAGARVIATASQDDKLTRLADLGVDHGINYRTTDFVEEVRRLTDGHGADVILDGVGGSVLQAGLRCLAYRGRCISFGDAGREHGTPIDVSSLRTANQTLVGYFLGAELITGDRAYRSISRLLADVADGSLRVVVDRVFPLAEAAAAHAYVESRRAFGRVLLRP